MHRFFFRMFKKYISLSSLGYVASLNVFPSHQFLQLIAAPDMNVVKEDLRDCAASCQLL